MEIETEHLVLREFLASDLEAMLEYKWNPRYLRFYEQSRGNKTVDDVERLLQRFLDWQTESPRVKFQLAITERGNDRLIGNVGVRKAKAESTDAEMGCELAPEYWNRGYATEATRALLAFGFERLGLHRVWASTMADNVGARQVLEKLGMQFEGELRETKLLAGGWANTVIYGILEHEWRTGAKETGKRMNETRGNPVDQEVERLYLGFLEGWNRREASEIAALFTADANVIGFDGSQMDGRDQIRNVLGEIFRDHATAAYLGIVRDVRVLSPGVTLLRAVVGMVPAGGTEINPAVNAIQTLVATRIGETWRIALLQTTPAAFHGRPDAVAQLTAELQSALRQHGLPAS